MHAFSIRQKNPFENNFEISLTLPRLLGTKLSKKNLSFANINNDKRSYSLIGVNNTQGGQISYSLMHIDFIVK